jgi:hypothetical protein
MNTNNEPISSGGRKPKRSHPFSRHVPTTAENAQDEWYVINHSSIIAYRSGSKGRSGAGWGK